MFRANILVLRKLTARPLLFLLYVNDMKEAVNCDLFLYADDSCLVYQHKGRERNRN